MNGPIQRYLTDDHLRLDGLLARAAADPERIDLEAYTPFRAGILRHIGIEEKMVLPMVRRRGAGELPGLTQLLHVDHAAIAALLVPTPSAAIVTSIREVLALHNPLEEDPGGLYDACDKLDGSEIDDLMARVKAAPEVPLMPYSDGERALRNIGHWMQRVRETPRRRPFLAALIDGLSET